MDRDRRRDRGLTLPEVLIVVVVTAILAVAIASVFSVIVRTVPPTEARTDDARTLLGLTTWLPTDVSSTPRIPVVNADADGAAFDTRDVASGCSESPGVNKLRLTWIEEHAGTRTYTASYRLTDDGSGSRLVRVACTNGGSASVINLTSTLPPVSTDPVHVTYRVDDSAWIVGVTMFVTTIDGDVLHVDSTSQFPVETLPPLTPVVLDPTTTATLETTPPVEETTPTAPPDSLPDPSTPTTEATTTTTSTTTTTTPPPCTASFVGVAPNPVHNANNATSSGNNQVTSGPLGAPVTINVSKGPNCGNLGLEYEHSPGSTGWASLSGTSQIQLPRDNLVAWDDGDRPLRLRDGQGGPVLETRMLTIT